MTAMHFAKILNTILCRIYVCQFLKDKFPLQIYPEQFIQIPNTNLSWTIYPPKIDKLYVLQSNDDMK